jgi:hypothetical protein
MIERQQTIGSDLVYAEGGSAWVKASDDPTLGRLFRGQDDAMSEPKLPSQPKRTRRQLATALMLAMIVVLSVLAGWLLLYPLPTTDEIDADLDQVRSEIKKASAEANKYDPSLVKSLIELRRKTFENTEAMLLQKKASLLRRISLSYTVDGKQLVPSNDSQLNEIREEIAQAEKKLAQSKKSAEQYSGGLIQAMALTTVETDELSVSQLRLKFYSAKHGLPFFFPAAPVAMTKPPSPLGNVVKEREAL